MTKAVIPTQVPRLGRILSESLNTELVKKEESQNKASRFEFMWQIHVAV